MTLFAELESDPSLGLATLANGVVSDLLHQSQCPVAHLPELVEIAVVGTGLGMLRNNIALVGKSGSFWDSTQWGAAPRPFLDPQALAYANAIAAWSRGDQSPEWARDTAGEIRRPMQNSVKFLFKANDSFFQPSGMQSLLGQSQEQWWTLASNGSPSQQVVALRHLNTESRLSETQQELLVHKLESRNRAILLHAIAAVERIFLEHPSIDSEPIVRKLKNLVTHRDDEVCAKAMCALTRMAKLDEVTADVASSMLERDRRHVIFAGAYALGSLDSVPEHTLELVDRNFSRALHACDYEFVALFAAGYNCWLENPRVHVEELLQHSPEFLPVALDALQQVPENLVSIA